MPVKHKKPVALAAVRPNAGLEVEFEKKLTGMVDKMHKSVDYWLRAAYKANTPEIAQDESPARILIKIVKRLGRRWQKQFDDAAPELADYFSRSMLDRSDAQLRAILKKSGFAIEFKLTREMNDVLQATMAEQVGLIRTISSDYFAQIEGMVMRSVAKGGALKELTDELETRYGVTRRRAALIARDQNAKATATMNRTRQIDLGITHAQWVHSHAGKKPRQSHVKAGADKLIYDVREGALIDGKRIWPGTEINCRCIARSILPPLLKE